jgi:hypothetical protein
MDFGFVFAPWSEATLGIQDSMKTLKQLLLVWLLILFGSGQALAAAPSSHCRPRLFYERLWYWADPYVNHHLKDGPLKALTTGDRYPLGLRKMVNNVRNSAKAVQGTLNENAHDQLWADQMLASESLLLGAGFDDYYFDDISGMQLAMELSQSSLPQIHALLLDDMSSQMFARGLKDEHLRRARALLAGQPDPLKLWGVVYSMDLDQPIGTLVDQLDVVFLWFWDANDLVELDQVLKQVETMAPGKPIVLGAYTVDFGGHRKMPPELLTLELEFARDALAPGTGFLGTSS